MTKLTQKEEQSQKSEIDLDGLGDNDNMPYAKADIMKACRINNNIALSFYQFDYQGMVNQLTQGNAPTAKNAVPVAKIVLSGEDFNRILNDLLSVAEKIKKQAPPTQT